MEASKRKRTAGSVGIPENADHNRVHTCRVHTCTWILCLLSSWHSLLTVGCCVGRQQRDYKSLALSPLLKGVGIGIIIDIHPGILASSMSETVVYNTNTPSV